MTDDTRPPLLEVADLGVTFRTPRGTVRAVDGIGFTVEHGRTLGLVGESGSGKSVTSLAVMGLHEDAEVSGSIALGGRELTGLSGTELSALRGRRMAMIFQDPLSSLHPYYTVGEQIAEAYRRHFGARRAVARRRAVEMLGEVGIPEPARRAGEYPHQFSGGMRQRVVIAMALACEPDLLIADEPTTALDVTVQAQILELIARIQQDRGLGVVMITHDLGVVARVAHEVLVMYGGRAAEQAPVDALFAHPAHPYTRGLLDSLPRLDDAEDAPLRTIPGSPPSLLLPVPGCAFAPRCPRVAEAESEARAGEGVRARCAGERPEFVPLGAAPGVPPGGEGTDSGGAAARLVACHLPLGAGGEPDGAVTGDKGADSAAEPASSAPESAEAPAAGPPARVPPAEADPAESPAEAPTKSPATGDGSAAVPPAADSALTLKEPR
ncbi:MULTISPECIES: ABC transporter ATP-binding protein [unclassified Streptomyces]|uniref:ABC transporter ATP-binding protein n=1 Tax=unclassified Streptomyces TaxID=2593676 RepID=UPI003870DFCF